MRWLRDNGLSIALFVLFALSLLGHVWTGWIASDEELLQEGARSQPLVAYLQSGQFSSSLF